MDAGLAPAHETDRTIPGHAGASTRSLSRTHVDETQGARPGLRQVGEAYLRALVRVAGALGLQAQVPGLPAEAAYFLLHPVAGQHVEQRVDHAVQAGQGQRAGEVEVQLLLKGAVLRLFHPVEGQGARQQQDVVGSEADGEDDQDGDGQQLDLALDLLLHPAAAPHLGEDPHVAEPQDQEGPDEGRPHPDQVEKCHAAGHGVALVAALVVVQGVLQFVPEQHQGVQGHDHGGHQHADGPGVAGTTEDSGLQGEGDGQATVHRNAAQQVDTDVHVGVVKEAGQLAGLQPQVPAVVATVIVNPEGHGENVEQVRDGQVEQVHPQHILAAHLTQDWPQRQKVEDQAEHEGQDVYAHQHITDVAGMYVHTTAVAVA